MAKGRRVPSMKLSRILLLVVAALLAVYLLSKVMRREGNTNPTEKTKARVDRNGEPIGSEESSEMLLPQDPNGRFVPKRNSSSM